MGGGEYIHKMMDLDDSFKHIPPTMWPGAMNGAMNVVTDVATVPVAVKPSTRHEKAVFAMNVFGVNPYNRGVATNGVINSGTGSTTTSTTVNNGGRSVGYGTYPYAPTGRVMGMDPMQAMMWKKIID